MRKYTSPTQTAEKLASIYNMTKEQVFKLRQQHDCMLTLEELKIKYNNPTMEALPDWITEEQLQDTITRCINSFHRKYNTWFDTYLTKEDVFMELYLHARMKLNAFNSIAMLSTSLTNKIFSIIYYAGRNANITPYSLYQKVNEQEKDNRELLDILAPQSNPTDEDNKFLLNIKSIKDKQLRELLIVIGYLVANISILHPLYMEVLDNNSETIVNNIKMLQARVEKNDEILRNRIDGIPCVEKRHKLTITDVIKALEYNKVDAIQHTALGNVEVLKTMSVKECLSDIQDYIKTYKIFG